MAWSLEGKRALVTGASTGIGAAVARDLAAAGCTVGICARRTDLLSDVLETCRATAPDSRAWTVDLADLDGIAAFAEQVERDLGPIDILVNNAGMAIVKRALDADEEAKDPKKDRRFESPLLLSRRHRVRHAVASAVIRDPRQATRRALRFAVPRW